MTGCANDKHSIPKNWAFEFYGAVYQGGVCPDCGKLVQGKFLGNVWTEETKETISVPDLDSPQGKKLSEHYVWELIKSGGLGVKDIFQRFNEACKPLPRKEKKIGVLKGYDLSKFEKDGWVVKPL